MENQMQLFNFDKKEVRVLTIDGEPWFVAKDVADILEYGKSYNILKYIDDKRKKVINPKDYNLGENENNQSFKMTLLNEAGLYDAIFNSKLDKAKEFKDWVFDDVLPTIRQTGMYANDSVKQQLLDYKAKIAQFESDQNRLLIESADEKQTMKEEMNKIKLENDQLINTIRKKDIRISSKMPLKSILKDVKYFLKDYTVDKTDGAVGCDELYEKYCTIRRHNDIHILIFEQAMYDYSYFKINIDGKEYWRDLDFK